MATVCCGDLVRDYDDGFRNRIYPLFCAQGQTLSTQPVADDRCSGFG
jgi:hypothetical protein